MSRRQMAIFKSVAQTAATTTNHIGISPTVANAAAPRELAITFAERKRFVVPSVKRDNDFDRLDDLASHQFRDRCSGANETQQNGRDQRDPKHERTNPTNGTARESCRASFWRSQSVTTGQIPTS